MRSLSSASKIAVVPKPRRPPSRWRPARVALVLAWAMFWLNTALFPCCEALAAAAGGHSDSVSQSVSVAPSVHHSDESNAERTHPNPSSPCDTTLNAEPAVDGKFSALPTDRANFGWFVIATAETSGPLATSHAANLAPREHKPPPPSRPYLRNQRLLI